jgi:hypothetical protein
MGDIDFTIAIVLDSKQRARRSVRFRVLGQPKKKPRKLHSSSLSEIGRLLRGTATICNVETPVHGLGIVVTTSTEAMVTTIFVKNQRLSPPAPFEG